MEVIERIVSGYRMFIRMLVTLAMGGLVVATILQVVFRYVLSSPLVWTEELARYLGIWYVMLSIGIIHSEYGHIGLDILPDGFTLPRLLLTNLASLIYSLFIIVETPDFLKVASARLTPALRLPATFVYVAIPIGFVLLAIHSLINLLLLSKYGRKKG